VVKKELPEGWEWKKIGDLIELKYGKGLKKGDRNHKGTVPVYGSNGIVGYHDVPLTQKSGIVIGRKGSVGAIHKSDVPFWAIDTTYYIESDDSLDISYLYYLLKTLKLDSLDKSTSIPGINRNDVYLKNIPVPPLETQRKIVAILEKAETTQRLRAEADALTQELVQSVFLEMFGDPVTNPMGWDTAKIIDLVDPHHPITYGIVQPGEDVDEGISMVRPVDLINNYVSSSGIKKVNPKIEKNYPRSRLQGGELLVSVRGTLGPVSIALNDLSGANISRGIAIIAPNNRIIVEYLLFLFKNERFSQKMLNASKGIALKQLNLEDLKELQIPVPPIEVQNKFKRFFEGYNQITDSITKSHYETDMLFNSIVNRAFSGELIT